MSVSNGPPPGPGTPIMRSPQSMPGKLSFCYSLVTFLVLRRKVFGLAVDKKCVENKSLLFFFSDGPSDRYSLMQPGGPPMGAVKKLLKFLSIFKK